MEGSGCAALSLGCRPGLGRSFSLVLFEADRPELSVTR